MALAAPFLLEAFMKEPKEEEKHEEPRAKSKD